MSMIRVEPSADMRVQFAWWCVQQSPKVGTCSHVEFAVPAHLFTVMPEELLIGARVDGHAYISPEPAPEPEPEQKVAPRATRRRATRKEA